MARAKSYPGTIEQRGSSFRVILYVDGTRHTFTLKDVSRKEAEQYAKDQHEKLSDQAKRRKLGLPVGVLFSELLEKYESDALPLVAPRTRVTYQQSLDRIREFFVGKRQDPPVADVRPGHIREYLIWRRGHRLRGSTHGSKRVDEPLSAYSLNKDRRLLHRLFVFAEELELREGNPVARVKAAKVEERDPIILTAEQFEELLRQCEHNPMLWLYVLALGETGGRCDSEILWLRWEDVDFAGGFLKIEGKRKGRRNKGGKARWVPLTPRLKAALQEHFALFRFATYNASPTQWVFHHVTTRRHAKAGQRIGQMRTAFGNAAARAKLPEDLRQHDLRHRRVTTWLAAGANPVHVKEAVGHADLRTTMGYTHLAREHLRSLVDDEGEKRKAMKEDLGS